MSKKAKVIHVEPAETEPARVPAKVIDLDAADARRVAEAKTKPPAAAKQTERPPYQLGYDDGYGSGFKEGTLQTIKNFVATVEQKLAEHDGYNSVEKWRGEATVPAWWIAVLMTYWKPGGS